MTTRPRQLALDLPVQVAYGRDDFLVSAANEAALRFIERWPAWPDRRSLLIGPPGAGKSHLAAIWAEASHALTMTAADLDVTDFGQLAGRTALVVENADARPLAERTLFHLLNHAAETGMSLLLTARDEPAHWGVTVPDLMSRLRLLPSVHIQPPDDALLRAVLVKLFDDRQLVIDAPLIDFLLRRMDRSLGAARALVAELDGEALSQGRRITRAMAADVMARFYPSDTAGA